VSIHDHTQKDEHGILQIASANFIKFATSAQLKTKMKWLDFGERSSHNKIIFGQKSTLGIFKVIASRVGSETTFPAKTYRITGRWLTIENHLVCILLYRTANEKVVLSHMSRVTVNK